MLHKDFFRLLIKIFGLYALTICLFSILPGLINVFISLERWEDAAMIICFTVIPFLFFLIIIFKSGWIVNLLKLDKGFEEEKIILGDLATTNILKLACIIIGGLLIIDNIPVLLNQGLYLFKESLNHHEKDGKDLYYFGVSAVKILIGYLLLRKFEAVSRLLNIRPE